MRAVLQRVSRAAVRVEGQTVGAIGEGLLVLLGVATGDSVENAERLAAKIARLRVFERDGRFDTSLLDLSMQGAGSAEPAVRAALVVSQFTLLADASKGNRPSFSDAARPEVAEPLYGRFCAELRALGVPIETGVFGARMEVELVNDGPVTIVLDVDTPE